MKELLKLRLLLGGMVVLATIGMSTVHAADKNSSTQETNTFVQHRITNAVDLVLFTAAAKVVNDYMISDALHLPNAGVLAVGVGTWLFGELVELVYKSIYERYVNKRLRETLGTIKIDDFEIDGQRLLRRIISLTTLALFAYGNQKAWDRYVENFYQE